MTLARPSLLLGTLFSLAAPAPANPAPFWQKTWTVAAITGDRDVVAANTAWVGKPVVLTQAHVETPVSDPCEVRPDYSDLRVRPRSRLPHHFGANWKFPASLGPKPMFGWVRCGGSNFGAFAFRDARQGFFFFEEGMVFVLR